ncbi:hypothetical protein CDB3_01275 [Bacillus sp. CDB3]|nr:hypothetical protein CDB3_01275 [Bacillus sp. CDB3]
MCPKEKEHLKLISGLKRGEELAVGMDRTPLIKFLLYRILKGTTFIYLNFLLLFFVLGLFIENNIFNIGASMPTFISMIIWLFDPQVHCVITLLINQTV